MKEDLCMPIGYRGHADWRDMSEYVVHFAKDVPGGKSAYNSMISILYSGKLEARTRYGAIRWSDALGDSQESVCFSEIPLDRLDRLVQRRSSYGIGFQQDHLIESGGGRVWYLNDESGPAASIRQLIDQKVGPPMDVDSPLWDLTPFIDFPGSYGPFEYRFEWEREWRVPGGLTFSPDQVAFLFMPSELHAQARRFFDEAEELNSGPNYSCPFLDPLWPDELIQQTLADL
jgi:hypothetical protein